MCFLLFIPSYYDNYWNVGNLNVAYFESEGNILDYEGYDPYPNMLIVGRLNESKKNGIFSKAGLPGLNYETNSVPDSIVEQMFTEQPRYIILYHNIIREYHRFLNDEESPDNYLPYVSQIGGQGIMFSFINNTLPFTNQTNYKIIKLFNAILVSLTFCLFLGWIYRNFGLISASITFIFIFFTPWLALLGSGLWWSIWGLYLPFLASLLILEKHQNNPNSIKMKHILMAIFFSVFFKCIFTGYEFSTSTLLAIYTPVVYYAWLNKTQLKELFFSALKIGLTALSAVFISLIILLLQIKHVMGGFSPAFEYLKDSYIRRTSFEGKHVADNIFEIVIKRYLQEDAFFLGFIDKTSPLNYFILTILVSIIAAILIYFSYKKVIAHKYQAIAVCSVFSLLSPLSWYYIFVQHSHQHPFYDNIVWYIPYVLYVYASVGIIISLIYKKVRKN